jgi:hypothetical protein
MSAPIKKTTRRHIPEGDILHSHRRENLKIYTNFFQVHSRAYTVLDPNTSRIVMGIYKHIFRVKMPSVKMLRSQLSLTYVILSEQQMYAGVKLGLCLSLT